VQRGWDTQVVSGETRIDGRSVRGVAQLAPGNVLETGSDAQARLQAARIGEVRLGADSRLRLVETRSGRHRLQLDHGTLWAKVWAPPGEFQVGTPSADAYDLGCEFVLSVDAAGKGRLRVLSGWVQLEHAGVESLVPQGALADLYPNRAPGTPYDQTASATFVAALRELDAQGASADPQGAPVQRLIEGARAQDVITLLSLLTRHPYLGEGPLFERTAALLPAAPEVTRDALRAHGAQALNPWWRNLRYPRLKQWWLQWPDAFGAPSKVPPPLNTSLNRPPNGG